MLSRLYVPRGRIECQACLSIKSEFNLRLMSSAFFCRLSTTTMTTAESPLRIAIIEADTPIESICKKYGSYGGVFTSLFHKAADRSGVPRRRLEFSGWDVVNIEREGEEEECGGIYNWKRKGGYPDLDSLDAILITGSSMWVCFSIISGFRKLIGVSQSTTRSITIPGLFDW